MIFGYTCVNDITASDILNRDSTFPQWARAKGIDGYGPFGPVITTGLDPRQLVVRTILNGAERQNYPISDMIFSAQDLVSQISQDMTLLPGDLICCGTSVGVGTMKEPVNTITVAIDGIGELTNEFRQSAHRHGHNPASARHGLSAGRTPSCALTNAVRIPRRENREQT
jgi:2-keto-4-pentenoate hydratase/2-oxohepta-3-ene-1,7-dioic acid hydratase in catechol pathway